MHIFATYFCSERDNCGYIFEQNLFLMSLLSQTPLTVVDDAQLASLLKPVLYMFINEQNDI